MVGSDLDTRSYFSFATSIIAIPTGIKILNWLATIRSSPFSLITPLYFIIGFPFSSTFGGFTGPIPANSIIDTILHDSYFIIGHPHHAPSSGAIYTISAAFYTYWISFSLISFSDYLGRIHSSSSFISSNSIFLTMHSLGIFGFPRRIYDYSMMYFKFQWSYSLGLIGIILSINLFSILIFIVIIILLFIRNHVVPSKSLGLLVF
jgi:heme/copper-type cytochrome/quinol oxidase subunit 1